VVGDIGIHHSPRDVCACACVCVCVRVCVCTRHVAHQVPQVVGEQFRSLGHVTACDTCDEG
jgi:hypothetical protein